ncbi:hypothetical protein EJB05_10604, partial [Eragrostis curvula]
CNTMRLNVKKFKCLYQPFAHTTSGASELSQTVLQIVHKIRTLFAKENGTLHRSEDCSVVYLNYLLCSNEY